MRACILTTCEKRIRATPCSWAGSGCLLTSLQLCLSWCAVCSRAVPLLQVDRAAVGDAYFETIETPMDLGTIRFAS